MDNQDFQIAQQIAKLEGIVTEGFRAIHQRQDTANGRTGKIEERVGKIEKEQTYNAGKQKSVSLIRAAIFAGLAFAIGTVLVPIISAMIAAGKIF